MSTHLDIRRGSYRDSVSLMQVSRSVQDVPGVEAALVAMATELNLEFLGPMGFDEDVDAGPNDLLVAIRAVDDAALDAAVAAADAALSDAGRESGRGFGEAVPPRTVGRAVEQLGGAEVVLVSTPGEHAFVEAMEALSAASNVMVFSDNVPLDQELALKARAAELDLLVMGPDCGTAIVGGVGLGFTNAVRPGPVGIVAASGTGAQHLTCLLDDAGVGVSHVLGVGGRDLKEEVGGATTLRAMSALDADPATELIVVLSKPPHPTVAAHVREHAEGLTTPVVLGLIGPGADDLTAVADAVLDARGAEAVEARSWPPDDGARRQPRSGLITGLFAGGTLCTEAMVVVSAEHGPVRSNVPLEPDWTLDGHAGEGHVMLDLGEDEYTRGRPHPMIDQQLRIQRLAEEAARSEVAVILLDVVLGHGAHPDPASELAPAIRDARATADAGGHVLHVVVSLCGAAGDPQGRDGQVAALTAAGASVHLSNADAAREAARLVAGAPA